MTDVTDVSRQDDASSSSSSSSTAAANGQLARALGPRGAVLVLTILAGIAISASTSS